MKQSVLILFLFVTVLVSNLFITEQSTASPVKELDFTLKDYNGKEYKLTDFNDSKAVVIMFIATECPVSNAYNSRMAALHKKYKDQGIAFIGINSNKEEDVSAIKSHASKNKFEFPVLKDVNNKVADNYGASVTPEIYVLDGKSNILYHGRIDDSRSESDVESKDLSNALDEILSGKKVSVAETKAFGCTIKRINS